MAAQSRFAAGAVGLLLISASALPAASQSALLQPAKQPPSTTDLALGDWAGRFAAPGYFKGAPPPLDFTYYAAREGRRATTGIVAGDFLILPRLDLDMAYDDNIFAKPSQLK